MVCIVATYLEGTKPVVHREFFEDTVSYGDLLDWVLVKTRGDGDAKLMRLEVVDEA